MPCLDVLREILNKHVTRAVLLAHFDLCTFLNALEMGKADKKKPLQECVQDKPQSRTTQIKPDCKTISNNKNHSFRRLSRQQATCASFYQSFTVNSIILSSFGVL
jgi:hypothetical protein